LKTSSTESLKFEVSKTSSEIYVEHLSKKKRGFPLWIPAPESNLTMEYQRRGVEIGDVGIITPHGAFLFLFSICLPADNPVNPQEMPEGFVPLAPPLSRFDVTRFVQFRSGSHVASQFIERSEIESSL